MEAPLGIDEDRMKFVGLGTSLPKYQPTKIWLTNSDSFFCYVVLESSAAAMFDVLTHIDDSANIETQLVVWTSSGGCRFSLCLRTEFYNC